MEGEEEMIGALRDRHAASGGSPATFRSGEWFLRDFFRFTTAHGAGRITDVTPELLDAYQRDLAQRPSRSGRPLSLNSQHDALSRVRSFLRFLVRTGRLLLDPTRDLAVPRAPLQLPEVLSRREMKRLLAAPSGISVQGVRDRAILVLFYETGLRLSELVGLQVADLEFETGTIVVRQGKGKKDRVVPMGDALKSALLRYLGDARASFLHFKTRNETVADPGSLFLGMKGRVLHKGSIQNLLRRYGRKLRLKKPVAPHVLRHTCATHLIEAGADIRMVQELLGHRDLATTERYTRMSLAHLKRVHRRRHPREQDGRGA